MDLNWFLGVLVCIFLITSCLNIFYMFLHPFLLFIYVCFSIHISKFWNDAKHGSYIRLTCKFMHHSTIFSKAIFSVRPFLTNLFKIKTAPLFYFFIFITFRHAVCMLLACLLPLFLIRIKPLRSKEFGALFKIGVSVLYLRYLAWAQHIVATH